MTPPRGPVMPTSVSRRCPGQHACVGGRHVGVGADDGGYAAVEVPAQRDFSLVASAWKSTNT